MNEKNEAIESRESAVVRWALLLVLIAGAALRLFWVLQADSQPRGDADPQWYYSVASNLVEGHGFTVAIVDNDWASGPGGHATTLWPPGWPFTLAAAFLVFGIGLTVAKLLNVIAGIITIYLVFRIGEMLFNRKAGLIGAALIAFYPNLIFWSSTLYADVYFTMWFCLALFLLVRTRDWRGKSAIWGAALLGAVIGVAALIRGQGLMLPIYALVFWLLMLPRAEALKRTGMVVAGAAIVILPWTVRNVTTFNEPILVSANDGFNMRIGHSPYATGRFVLPADLWTMDPGISDVEREALFSREGRRLAVEYALEHPGDEIALSAKKLFYLFVPDSDALDWANYGADPGVTDPTRSILVGLSDAYYWLLMLAGIGGLVIARRVVAVRWLLFVFATWAVFHIVFFAEPRFHIPLLPLVAIVAAPAILKAYEEVFKEPDKRPAGRRKAQAVTVAGRRRRG